MRDAENTESRRVRQSRRLSGCLLVSVFWLSSLLQPAQAAQALWPAKVVADDQLQDYQPLGKAGRQWRLCALLPHGKDHY